MCLICFYVDTHILCLAEKEACLGLGLRRDLFMRSRSCPDTRSPVYGDVVALPLFLCLEDTPTLVSWPKRLLPFPKAPPSLNLPLSPCWRPSFPRHPTLAVSLLLSAASRALGEDGGRVDTPGLACTPEGHGGWQRQGPRSALACPPVKPLSQPLEAPHLSLETGEHCVNNTLCRS